MTHAGRLGGRTAIVFGAGAVGPGWGNGRATAVLFAREGAHVVAVDRDAVALEATRDALRGEGLDALALSADVTRADDVARVVDATLERHGAVDVLQNNVGFATLGGPEELSEAQWDAALTLNLKSMFLTCKAVLPRMVRAGRGAIVNVSSIASERWLGTPYVSYATAKAGVNQFTRSIAMQYASRGIRANVVVPGMMRTPNAVASLASEYADVDSLQAKRDAMCPMGRQGDAWDVAYASLFLASDEAKYVTGVLLHVDGGLSCSSGDATR